MSAMRGYTCDGPTCARTAVTKDHHTRPDGWVLVFGDGEGRSSWHFCSWPCLQDALVVVEPGGRTQLVWAAS